MIAPAAMEHTQFVTCERCQQDRQCHHRADGLWLCPLCSWSGIPGCGTDPETERKALAWDALVLLLPTLGEWERGRILALDGRLLDWVLRQAKREGRSGEEGRA